MRALAPTDDHTAGTGVFSVEAIPSPCVPVFDVAVSDDGISVYRLDIEAEDGLTQTGLPPRFEE